MVGSSYHEGMLGIADARLRRQRIFVSMVPALKSLFHHVRS